MDKDCYVIIKDDLVEAEFIGVYQYSNVIDANPMVGGQPGGVIAYPIVKLSGKLKVVDPSKITFKR
ncbi:hypothetical protein [Pseudogracilibacillus sp. SO30301A]|uniref:hypothetical protein n=1 Tax=Pseudogracilibacillus sp. SO30301A TaxID=3098291 RepID=UPI00300E5BF1